MKANTISSRFDGASSTSSACLSETFMLNRLHARHHRLVVIRQREQLCALLAFDEHADGAVGQLEQLQNGRDHADVVQIVALRVVLARIELRNEEDFLVAFHRGFERGNRTVAADKQRHDHVRENDDVAQRKKRIRLRHYSSWAGSATGHTALVIGCSSLIWRSVARIQCRCAEQRGQSLLKMAA
jgi:hypothetical protein